MSAPAVSPGRKKRENVFFQPGVQGRKTGITIKDTGRRDEHGFEPLDAIFSSPEKSPPKRPARGDLLDKQNSPAPEPTNASSTRRATRSARVSLPPPKARSPIKTHLNSSPQRHPSLAPASVARQSLGSPIRPAQMASVKRRIDFNQDIPRKSVEISPRKPQRGGRSSDAENMPPSVDAEEPGPVNELDTYMPMGDDESMQMLEFDNAEAVAISPAHGTARRQPTEGAGKRKTLFDTTVPSPPTSTESLKRKREAAQQKPPTPQSRSPTPHVMDEDFRASMDDTMAGALPVTEDTTAGAYQITTSRMDAFDVHRDATVEVSDDSADDYQDEKPAKKSRKSSGKTRTSKQTSRTATSKAPKERDANARPPARKRAGSKTPSEDAQGRNSRAPSKPRSLQILRQGTPLEEPGATKTRSGRQSIQPVAWWCGERINREFDGTIRDVIRAETVNLSPKRNAKRPTRPKKTALGDIPEEEDEEDSDRHLEPWELNGGILSGLVKDWDPEYNMTIEEPEIERELAFASSAIKTRDVMGANFSYAKFVTCSFFAAGVVDLQPGGFKRAKNSRKMQMVFFVHTGKVLVTIGDLEFSISRGGAWQVPRGNFYSIENRGSKPSRIFFAQGNEPVTHEEIEG